MSPRMHILTVSVAGPRGYESNGSGNLYSCAWHCADKLQMTAMMLVRRVRLCLCPFVKVDVINYGLQIYCFYFVRVYYFVKFARMCKYLNAMKKSYILLATVVMMTVTGCDFFRKLAGRPTSDVIEVKRQEMIADLEAKAARQKAVEDSLALVARNEADSIEACRYIKENGVRLYTSSSLGGIVEDGVWPQYDGSRYRVIVGSFRDKGNAQKKLEEVGEAGDFAPHFIRMRNGMIAVGTCPVNEIHYALAGFKELRSAGACPEDAWILKIE